MANRLELEIVLYADALRLINETRSSQAAWESISSSVKKEAEAIRTAINLALDGLDKMASGNVTGGANRIADPFLDASKQIAALGDKSAISASELRTMRSTGEQAFSIKRGFAHCTGRG